MEEGAVGDEGGEVAAGDGGGAREAARARDEGAEAGEDGRVCGRGEAGDGHAVEHGAEERVAVAAERADKVAARRRVRVARVRDLLGEELVEQHRERVDVAGLVGLRVAREHARVHVAQRAAHVLLARVAAHRQPKVAEERRVVVAQHHARRLDVPVQVPVPLVRVQPRHC